MTKMINKNDEWYKSIHLKSFRSEKAVIKYMSETSQKNWRAVDVQSLPEKAHKIFGLTSEEFCEFYDFYENDEEQYISIRNNMEGDLWDIGLLSFIEKMNIVDSEKTPLLVNFFKSYVNNPQKISGLFLVASDELGFENISKKTDLRKINQWVVFQIENRMNPLYFQEKYYAYLIIIVGELILKNKLKDFFWKIEYSKIHLINEFDEDIKIKHIYNPYLCNKEGVKLDIHQACREYLFYEKGNMRHVFTSIYNNIEKYDVKKLYPTDYHSKF
ncbi:hypothetical protein [Psychrobacter lutiphocae]|uniref:hypothetical protein n=1 Tax=Psychrobacter lutiphocae TaxID=540500 RepID=UPI00036EC4A6|nr:hypothetical protein [Psychrobacter lutiphocae]